MMRNCRYVLAALLLMGALPVAAAPFTTPLISEIYFNPPGGSDASTGLEYIELLGPANMSLNDHYLIFLENENDEFNSQNPGQIERIFNLSGMAFGSNGFMVLAARSNAGAGVSPYPALNNATWSVPVPANPAAPTVAESLKVLPNGANAYINRDTGTGFGNGLTSSLQYVGESTELEGSGFTAMLIYVDSLNGGLAPELGDDLDVTNNGLDHPSGQPGWTILDSIGMVGELGEEYARLYSQVVFSPGPLTGPIGGVEPGAQFVDTSASLFEIEYVARVALGNGASSWMATNLTDNAASGYTLAQRNYGVSGNHATQSEPEVFVGYNGAHPDFPYGTDITVTFGAPNVGFYVPEPSSFLLLGMGVLGGLAVVRRRVGK